MVYYPVMVSLVIIFVVAFIPVVIGFRLIAKATNTATAIGVVLLVLGMLSVLSIVTNLQF